MDERAATCIIHPAHLNVFHRDERTTWSRPCVPGRTNGDKAWYEWSDSGEDLRHSMRPRGYWYSLCFRSATQFVELASRFKCDVRIAFNGEEANGKSIMGLPMTIDTEGALTLELPPGSPVLAVMVRCSGADAAECLGASMALLEHPYYETPSGATAGAGSPDEKAPGSSQGG